MLFGGSWVAFAVAIRCLFGGCWEAVWRLFGGGGWLFGGRLVDGCFNAVRLHAVRMPLDAVWMPSGCRLDA
eukprot:6481665-Lingulodinium_polyedra.AAC.1